MKSGVYEIVNMATCKKYIGSSKNVPLRLRQHLLTLKRGAHFNVHLQNSFNKYNENAFIFRPIIFCKESEMVEMEMKYVKEYMLLDSTYGYNIRVPNMVTMAEETKEKIRKATRGLNTWTKGVKREQWVRDILRKSLSGLKRSDESRARYKVSKTGEKNSMVKLTEQDVLKIIELRETKKTTYKELASMFGVTVQGISNIFNGHTWVHVTNKKSKWQ